MPFCVTGSLLANLNHNNLKYGTEISRTPSFMQGAMTPLSGSPNKNVGPERIILLVCNRACTGHQAKRYCYEMYYFMPFCFNQTSHKPMLFDGDGNVLCFHQVRLAFCTLHGAHCDLGCSTKRDPGENAASFKAWRLHSGRKTLNSCLDFVCFV